MQEKYIEINCCSADTLALEKPPGLITPLQPGTSGPDMFRVISVRPGFCMYAIRIDPKRMPGFDFKIQQTPVQFGFCLSGETRTQYNMGNRCRNAEFINRTGTNSVCCMSRIDGKSRLLSDKVSNCVAIQIDREILNQYLGTDADKIPAPCRQVLDGEHPICGLPMTGEMHQTAAQVFATTYKDAARQLFLEAKALELLSLQIARLIREPSPEVKSLTSAETENIRAAGDILINSMQEPPTIAELARMVGTNEFKLKKGFKQVFNATIFQFLQHHRMAAARDIIVNQGANVSQAADFIGYVNIGHFIACYKKAFGSTPGAHKQATR
ncbi:MAG: AraC family transcriptional regulator [Desulfobacterales bacterium]|nr:AraC family transcriptional regulator [Desulfobacterales bacterium]